MTNEIARILQAQAAWAESANCFDDTLVVKKDNPLQKVK